MPLIFIFLAAVIAALNWDWVTENVVPLGAISTAFAFLATTWAAYETRGSARAALKAVNQAEATLTEARKADFKQWLNALLEQHKEKLTEVIQHLANHSEINEKLATGNLNIVHSTIVKDYTLTSYCKHIHAILNYIDNDFYVPSNDIQARQPYISQLSLSIPQNIKVVIAVYALHYPKDTPTISQNLYHLLSKFDFFKEEVFFDDGLNHRFSPKDYTDILFSKEYGNTILACARDAVIYGKVGNQERIFPERSLSPSLKTVIIASYSSIFHTELMHHLTENPSHLKKIFADDIQRASNRCEEIIDSLHYYQSYRLELAGGKRRRIIKNNSTPSKGIAFLLQHYTRRVHKYTGNNRLKYILLVPTFPNGTTNSASDIKTKLHEFAYFSTLLSMKDARSIEPHLKVILQQAENYTNGIHLKIKAFSTYP